VILKNILGALVLSLLTICAFLYFKTGAHKDVVISESKIPDYHFFYKDHTGPYHEINSLLISVEEAFKKLEIKCTKTFGLYLSDPAKVDHDRLKSKVGCAFDSKTSPQLFAPLPGIKSSFYDLPLENPEDASRLKCYKGSFTGSPSLSAMKVYPKIKDRAKDEGVKLFTQALEIYVGDEKSHKTTVYLCGIK